MRGQVAGRGDILVLDESGRFRKSQVQRRVVGTDNGDGDSLRRDFAGMVVDLYGVDDVEISPAAR